MLKSVFAVSFLLLAISEGYGQLIFSVSTDKTFYARSETIQVTITARNPGNVPDTLTFPSSCEAGYYIDSLSSMQHDSIIVTCLDAFFDRIVPANDFVQWRAETSWPFEYTGEEVGAGKHAITAWLAFLPQGWNSDTLWITVGEPTGIAEGRGGAESTSLESNFPNPFNPTTRIQFRLAHSSYVSLRVYDVLGREAAVLAEGNFNAGRHALEWNGGSYPAGVYFCRLTAGLYSATRKLILLK